ncbi:MAG: ribosome recycling factor [Candidatus Improbicoccus pseudotrichonymphae]|uniref:Ribosome-recycling factor n=1 Tax=Candidatus Improbicoccus pseudotrichonymphae TaxID=3033792 RepID=A0AA48KYG8_9FIRM|nr:MAG: ribosome recycling factor [Candidatus Improbicoccus pseudotrichonymphae]
MEGILKDFETSLDRNFAFLKDEYKKIRADRVDASILDKIKVECFGSFSPINQLASVSVAESRILSISPWDITLLNSIEKAILKSDIGVSPQNDGKVIKCVFPPLSQERRNEFAKEVSKKCEESKISIRNFRHEFMTKLKNMKKKSEISTDEIQRLEKQIQKSVDVFISKTDTLKEEKTKQIFGG